MGFETMLNDRSSPIRGGVAVQPGSPIPTYVRALWIGAGGTLVVRLDGMDDAAPDLEFANLADGVLIPMHVTSIEAGTTCTDILALW